MEFILNRRIFLKIIVQKWHILLVFFISILTILFYGILRNQNEDDFIYLHKGRLNFTINKEVNKLNNSVISNMIRSLNEKESIQNFESFGAITKDTVILVILLDKLSSDFKIALTSLSLVYGMNEILLVFSHSYYDENLNNMIRSIDFCRVLQIYYPYSIQTHQNEFPGYSTSDCRNRRFGGKCNGSRSRDMRGLFREPSRSQKKQHWWWTANTVFGGLSCTENHKGLVIFTEGNSLFLQDFIYIAQFMKNIADYPPKVDFLSFGGDTIPPEISPPNFYAVKHTVWTPNDSGMLAFDSTSWNSIVGHYDVFCTFDDASWQRSLYFISVKRRDGKRYNALSTKIPRVFKFDSPGFLAGLFGSDSAKNILLFRKFENASYGHLFPAYLETYSDVVIDDDDDVVFDYSEGDGGWADERDWELCQAITKGKFNKVLLDMKKEFREYFVG